MAHYSIYLSDGKSKTVTGESVIVCPNTGQSIIYSSTTSDIKHIVAVVPASMLIIKS